MCGKYRPKPELKQSHYEGYPLTVYGWEGFLQNEPFKDKRLELSDESVYQIITYDSLEKRIKESEAEGWYSLVVLLKSPNIAYVRRTNQTFNKKGIAINNSSRGHSSIAQGSDEVIFAGEAFFKKGKLEQWTPKTGHYKVGQELGSVGLITKQIEKQTIFLKNSKGTLLLPMLKFIYDID